MAYATVEELARLLRLQSPSASQVTAMERVLEAAASEIDWYLSPDPFPADHPLVVEVNLERAVEHWQQGQSPFGIIGLGAETMPVVAARNSWYRHGRKLAPLKLSRGVA